MPATRARQRKMVEQLGMYFAELGYLPNRTEYSKLYGRPAFVTVKEIDKVCSSWTKMLAMMEKDQPELWELIHKVPDIKKEPTIAEKLQKAKTAVAE